MSLEKYRMKFKKNLNKTSEGSPQYSLTYSSDTLNAGRISHEIISAFIDKNDVIIEINSDMSGPIHNQSDPVTAFLDKASTFNLAYKKKNVLSEKSSSLLGLFIGSKKRRQASEALIYIPNSVWCHPDLKSFLPLYGAKYYIANETADASAKLNEIAELNEEDKAGAFKIIIFDLAICGQMGVSSASLSMDEIKGMLGL